MNDTERFGAVVALVAAVALVAIMSNRLTERIRVPAPALFLIGAAVASDLVPPLRHVLPFDTVEQVVTVALVVLLFDGGMHIGWGRLRRAAGAVLWIGVAGTLVTAAAVAVLAHLLFGLDWRMSLLLGTALAPTDPAVVFSVLGRREIIGRSGTLLEGESGANDPVGIALMVSILAADGGGFGAVGTGVVTFAEQMVVGLAVGVLGGLGLRWFMRRVSLPSEALYPLRTLVCAVLVYGVATVAHGSGFLAVFVAGIMIGDVKAPFKAEIARFHSALASLGEIVAFVVLGLTVSLRSLPAGHSWQIGLVLAVLLALVVRPALVGLLLWPVRLSAGERVFVLWAGLKGAVPVLLGVFIIVAGPTGATRVYDIIFVVVAFSVIVQGGLVPLIGRRCGVPMRAVEPRPWVLGMRFSAEPARLDTHTVATGSPADGVTAGALARDHRVWVTFVRRAGRFVPLRPDTTLHAGDEVLVDHAGDSDTNPFTTG